MTAYPADGLSEDELRRTLLEAQRQADTVFAQYQLSQLLALGGELRLLAAGVVGELVRASDAVAGAIWLAAPGDPSLALVATEPDLMVPPVGPTGWVVGPVVRDSGHDAGDAGNSIPAGFPSIGAARSWVDRHGWHGVSLDERRDLGDGTVGAEVVGFLALCPAAGQQLPVDRVRMLAMVRHELAIALRAAQLRQRLASEQALLAAVFDAAGEGILAVDARRQVVRMNRAAASLLGGRVARTGAACAEVLSCGSGDDLRCGPRCRVDEVLREPAGHVETELALPAGDAGEIPVAASFSAMDRAGSGAVVLLRDLRSERAAEELRASFLAAVSHELRTPLALITGHVDSLLDLGLDPAEQRQSVERIGHAAARLQALVDELLDLTQLEHASLALHRSRMEVGALLDGFVASLGEWPGMPALRVDVPVGMPPVQVDVTRVGHVLVNLVDNARRYGGPGAIEIQARRHRGTVVITVEDGGTGIPAAERPLVFDRLYRGRAARDTHPGGTGLGLYVCRRLIEAHGGRIWIEPEPGRSAISFSLPASRRSRPARVDE